MIQFPSVTATTQDSPPIPNPGSRLIILAHFSLFKRISRKTCEKNKFPAEAATSDAIERAAREILLLIGRNAI